MTVTLTARQSKVYLKYLRLRREFILALGGKCQYVKPNGQVCGWSGEGDILLLEIHHAGGRSPYDHNQAIREIYEFGKTGKIPKDVQLLCPNHHAVIDSKLGKWKRLNV